MTVHTTSENTAGQATRREPAGEASPGRTITPRAIMQRHGGYWIAAEVLLIVYSIACVRLLGRLYDDTTYFLPMVFAVVVGHGALISMRWFGFGGSVSALVSFIGVVLAVVATHYSDTATAVLIPNADTLGQFRDDLVNARLVFDSMQAPVPPVTGFIVAGSLIYWLLAVTADWAAFRLFAPGQALCGGLTVLIFVALLGVETQRVFSPGLLVATGVLFLLAHRAALRAAQGIWLGEGSTRAYTSLLLAGGLVAFAAALAGIIGGPAVPGADEAPLVELGNDGRRQSQPIEVVSPLVQIQPRLIDQSDELLFTVETNQRAYWRMAALDVFDGLLWRSNGQYGRAGDDLDVVYDASVPVDLIDASFDLGNLAVVWAPAPYLPIGVENLSAGIGLNYEAESATFIVDTSDQATSDGLRYIVRAEAANLTPEMLRRLPEQNNDSIDAKYLELPEDFSPVARSQAEQITAGLTDPYDQALALQNYFRDNFTYDLDVAKGHDIRRIDDFLTVQRGYCEQFAGTFASMARSIGLPARVATGFTPGDPDPQNPNRYLVRGRHAHAWPEVWIAGAGWVAFEPTPGRGAPNATSYTGVPESQESTPTDPQSAQEQQAELANNAEALPVPPTPTPVAPQPTFGAAVEVETETEPPEIVADEPGARPWLVPLLILAALTAWVIGIPALKRWKSARRTARVGDDTRRLITLEWAALVDRLERLGHPPKPDETLSEYCERMQMQLPVLTPSFSELTELAVGASYDHRAPTVEQAEQAAELGTSLQKRLLADEPFLVRSAWEVDPRPLLQLSDPIAERAERLASGALS